MKSNSPDAWTGDSHGMFYAKKSGATRKGVDKDGLKSRARRRIEEVKQEQSGRSLNPDSKEFWED